MTAETYCARARPVMTALRAGERGEDVGGFILQPRHTRPDGRVFGGTLMAAGVEIAETMLERDAIWATTQFTGTASVGERLDLEVEVRAEGRRTSQARVSIRAGSRSVAELAIAMAAPGQGGITRTSSTMPAVTPPESCRELDYPQRCRDDSSLHLQGRELRLAHPRSDPLGNRRSPEIGDLVWARRLGSVLSRPLLAYLADVPNAIVTGSDRLGIGVSLDNTIRYGEEPVEESEWVLLECRPQVIAGGYGHGHARMWSPGGRLLATVSQTATVIPWTNSSDSPTP